MLVPLKIHATFSMFNYLLYEWVISTSSQPPHKEHLSTINNHNNNNDNCDDEEGKSDSQKQYAADNSKYHSSQLLEYDGDTDVHVSSNSGVDLFNTSLKVKSTLSMRHSQCVLYFRVQKRIEHFLHNFISW